MLELDPVGVHTEVSRQLPLEVDRDIAQADGPMAGVEERLRDDPDRVREVDEPRVRRRAPGGLLGDVEHDRHGPQRFREATRPRRLLADGTEPRWQRLVDEARRLAADP